MPSHVGAPTDICYLPLRKSAGICREESVSKNACFLKGRVATCSSNMQRWNRSGLGPWTRRSAKQRERHHCDQ